MFIVGGLEHINSDHWGVGWPFHRKRSGGNAVVAGNVLTMSIIAHELGHAFGLYHTHDVNAIMGPGHDVFLNYEVRWLNKSHYFNDVDPRTLTRTEQNLPQLVNVFPSSTNNNYSVRFQIEAKSKNGLYYCKICRDRDVFVVGHNTAQGNNNLITIDAKRSYFVEDDKFWVQLMDVQGNYIQSDHEHYDTFIKNDRPQHRSTPRGATTPYP